MQFGFLLEQFQGFQPRWGIGDGMNSYFWMIVWLTLERKENKKSRLELTLERKAHTKSRLSSTLERMVKKKSRFGFTFERKANKKLPAHITFQLTGHLKIDVIWDAAKTDGVGFAVDMDSMTAEYEANLAVRKYWRRRNRSIVASCIPQPVIHPNIRKSSIKILMDLMVTISLSEGKDRKSRRSDSANASNQ